MFSSGLLTYRDTPENVLNQLIQQYKDNYQISIGFHQEVPKEETNVEKAIRQLARDNNIQIKEFWTSTLYHPDDLPYNNPNAYVIYLFFSLPDDFLRLFSFPDVYTQFRVALEKQGVRVRRLINTPNTFKPSPDDTIVKPIPNLSDFGYSSMDLFSFCKLEFFCLDVTVHSNSVFPFEGGESSGLAHLHNYIWNKNLVRTYKQTRNSLTGTENTTKFSAWYCLLLRFHIYKLILVLGYPMVHYHLVKSFLN